MRTMQIVTNRKKAEFSERQNTGKRHAIALSSFACFEIAQIFLDI